MRDPIEPEYHTLGKRNVAATPLVDARGEELRAAYQRIMKLEADLLECRDFIDPFVDVVDGADGRPAPNPAMRLVSMIDESLHGSLPLTSPLTKEQAEELTRRAT